MEQIKSNTAKETSVKPSKQDVKRIMLYESGKIISQGSQSQSFPASKNKSSQQSGNTSAQDKVCFGINLGNQTSLVTRQFNYQAILLHTNTEEISPLTDKDYPLAISNIVNKPFICYQIEYLQKYGIHDIMITVVKKHAHKIEKYIRNHFQNQDPKSKIELIVFQEEKEHIEVLQMLQPKIYADIIVMESNSIYDVPLDSILDTHRLAGGSITTLLKEFDMKKDKKGSKAPVNLGSKLTDVETDDIFGISSWSPDQIRVGEYDNMYQYNRIVMKTTKMNSQFNKVNVKKSLLKKCGNFKVRADLGYCGLYVFQYQTYKMMLHLNQEKDYQWNDIAEDVIPYMARNQYKEQLQKFYDDANKDKSLNKQDKDFASRIEMMLNPDKVLVKDNIKIIAYIDPATSQSNFIKLKMNNYAAYVKANLDGQMLLQRQQQKWIAGEFPGPLSDPHLFSFTPNNIPDLLSVSKEKINNIKESNISVINEDEKTVEIGEGCAITKSVIGRNVKIGAKTQISRSVILGNCTIGANCVIQDCLILSSCKIADKLKVIGKQIDHNSVYDKVI